MEAIRRSPWGCQVADARIDWTLDCLTFRNNISSLHLHITISMTLEKTPRARGGNGGLGNDLANISAKETYVTVAEFDVDVDVVWCLGVRVT